MTAEQLRLALKRLGYTQRGFARYVGANERTVRRWVDGEQDIPGWVPVLIGLLDRIAA